MILPFPCFMFSKYVFVASVDGPHYCKSFSENKNVVSPNPSFALSSGVSSQILESPQSGSGREDAMPRIWKFTMPSLCGNWRARARLSVQKKTELYPGQPAGSAAGLPSHRQRRNGLMSFLAAARLEHGLSHSSLTLS